MTWPKDGPLPSALLIVVCAVLRKPLKFQTSSKVKLMMGNGVYGGDPNPVGTQWEGKGLGQDKSRPKDCVDPEGWEIEYRVSQSGGALRRPGEDSLCLH